MLKKSRHKSYKDSCHKQRQDNTYIEGKKNIEENDLFGIHVITPFCFIDTLKKIIIQVILGTILHDYILYKTYMFFYIEHICF